MSDARQVYSDLVRAACSDIYFEKAEVRELLDRSIMRYRGTP